MKKLLLLFFILSVAIQSQAQCDNSKRPIVFIHGFLASGDSYSLQVQRFIAAGYCPNRLFVFDWNSVTRNGKKTDSLLNSFIDSIISLTGARQIDLAGHSAGGGLGRGYLIDSVHASKVAHYVHLGSNKWVKDLNWFRNSKCLNVYSKSDNIIGTVAGQIAGATNLDLEDKDHYEVATSQETFEAIYQFLNDGALPIQSKGKKISPIQISGKAVLLGDNEPLRNSVVNIYLLHSKTGMRRTQQPAASFTVTATGHWGTFAAMANKPYEMELIPDGENERSISFFFEPFTQSNSNIYLRGFPKGNMISMLLGNLPAKDSQSVIAIFSSNKAMIGGRDSVTINKIPVSSSLLTPASKTIISSFIFDDGDGISSGKALKQFSSAPFIGGVDISLPVNAKKATIVYFNGRKLVLPTVSSNERILLAVFN